MSTDAITLVKSRRVGSPTTKAVLFVLADYADAEWSSFVGQKRLAAETELTDRTVRTALAELEGRGLIVRQSRHRSDGTRTSDRIVLRSDAIGELPEARSATYRKQIPTPAEGRSGHEPPVEPRTPIGVRERDISTDEIGSWTALEDLFGEASTESERKRRGKIVRSLNRAGATFSEVHRRAGVWHQLFPPSNGRKVTLTDFALEKWWGQLGKLIDDKPAEWSEAACTHPEDRRAVIEDSTYCGLCRKELTDA